MTQNRLKSPVFWSSLVAQILSILVLTGTIGGEWSGAVQGIAVAVLEALTVFGVLNNPADKTGF